ncbi:MAG: DsbA family protein [Paracoccaceae bacterium]
MNRFTSVLGSLAVATLSAVAWVGSGTSEHAQVFAQEVDTSTILEMTLGEESAPVEVIEYASYTCPHCRSFHEGNYKKLKSEYIDTGKVKFIYREVYFDRYGLWASMIARCTGPDRFFGVTDLIYEGQAEWTRAGEPAAIVEELRKIGRLAGLNNDDLEACLQDGDKARTLVAWYQENAEKHDITGTPSFIVNGKKVSNMAWDDFKALLDAEIGS